MAKTNETLNAAGRVHGQSRSQTGAQAAAPLFKNGVQLRPAEFELALIRAIRVKSYPRFSHPCLSVSLCG
jgi:hypothetical protein